METSHERDRLFQVLDRVRAGEVVLVLRRGKPRPPLVKPSAQRFAFRSRQGLRAELPAMRLKSGETVRDLRNAERF
ncbi:hypothetical protein [Thiohalorhabdus sp.]|uniref:hypothetical protein n=1 Tax=Thiohalorhabdus sp. TaxID=3094134 RepID=UPI002FC2CE57